MARDLTPLVADVHTILTRTDGQVLMMVRANTGFRDGEAGLPSGHLEPGETVEEGALRELKEEIGVVAQPADLVFSHVMHRYTAGELGSRASFFFSVSRWVGEPVNAEERLDSPQRPVSQSDGDDPDRHVRQCHRLLDVCQLLGHHERAAEAAAENGFFQDESERPA